MTFFFVLGLEARREFDLGELRERRRFALPLLAGIGGMAVAVAIYLAFNAGRSSSAAGGSRCRRTQPSRSACLRSSGRASPTDCVRSCSPSSSSTTFALLVIATVYTERVSVWALFTAVGLFGAVLVVRALRVEVGLIYFALGAAIWVALLESGVEPVVVGLAMGLLVYAYPVRRSGLERRLERFREFREQPTQKLARSVGMGLRAAVSPNERLQQLYHPWTSYLIVPVFALASCGGSQSMPASSPRPSRRPFTLGILLGYVVGKPVGILGCSWLLTRLSRRRASAAGRLGRRRRRWNDRGDRLHHRAARRHTRVRGTALEEAKFGILSAAFGAALLTWLLFRATALLPRGTRIRALLGTAEPLADLYIQVDRERDHIRGPMQAPVTVIEYGDFQCPYCGLAEPVVRELLREFGDVRYVWRHLPLNDVHADTHSPRKPQRPPPTRARSGRCTTSCSNTKRRFAPTS